MSDVCVCIQVFLFVCSYVCMVVEEKENGKTIDERQKN